VHGLFIGPSRQFVARVIRQLRSHADRCVDLLVLRGDPRGSDLRDHVPEGLALHQGQQARAEWFDWHDETRQLHEQLGLGQFCQLWYRTRSKFRRVNPYC
jgi:hypothetical protein